jgi:class 3 adenylate cyclase/tetratricopeptide (TPR) repeat protein
VQVCPSCGEGNPDRFSFCGVCGSPLTAGAETATETRKTVTVLFCDLVGSTQLGGRLDPEVLREVMSRYFDATKAAIERHGGTVEKFIGDAVMAVFGVPRVHEDDALRAARAAIDKNVLRGLNDELRVRHGVTLHTRIGINTGGVVAGDASKGQKLVSGDAVNIAARLEQAAGEDEILIGPSTNHLVRDYALTDAIPWMRLKGKEEPAAVFRLFSLVPGESRRIPRMHSPLVGRERERALLMDAFHRSAAEFNCHLFTVLGAAGIGKSRLVNDALTDIAPEATVLEGRCLSYGEGITFWPLTRIVREAAGFKETDTVSDSVAKIASLFKMERDAPVLAERVAQLLGLVSAHAAPEALFSATRTLFEALARERPLAVVLEDVHWAEDGLLSFIEHLADWSRDAPILLICTARPEFLDDNPTWGGGKLNATSVLLEPLGRENSVVLIENLLQTSDLGPQLRGHIAAAADGNCLFVEEIVAMLIEDGVVSKREGRWIQSVELPTLRVPPTIQALLVARLDRLSPSDRRMIERAAIVGHTFYPTAVAELSPPEERADVPARLMALVRKELIRPDRSDFMADNAFRFRHALIRDAAYDAMPKTTRAELHERFGQWLEGTAGPRAEEYAEFIGHHLAQAHRYLAELGRDGKRRNHLAAGAAEYLAIAGRRALGRGNLRAAVTLLDRAVSIASIDTLTPDVLIDLGLALGGKGELTRSDSVFERAITLARDVGDVRLEWRSRVEHWFVRLYLASTGAPGDASRGADRAIEALGTLGDHLGLAKAWRLKSEVAHLHSLEDRARAASERALDHARKAGDSAEESSALQVMWLAVRYGSTPVRDAIRFFVSMEEQLIALGHAARGSTAFGVLEAMEGRFDKARATIAIAQANRRERGDEMFEAGGAHHLGQVELLADNPGAAEKAVRVAYDLCLKMGDRAHMSTYVVDLAEALYRLGRYDEALEFTVISEEAADPEDVASQAGWRSVRAKLLAKKGQFNEALEMASAAVTMLEAAEWPEGHGAALMALSEVFSLARRGTDAVPVLRRGIEVFARKGIVVSAEKAQRILSELTSSAPRPGI